MGNTIPAHLLEADALWFRNSNIPDSVHGLIFIPYQFDDNASASYSKCSE